MNKLKIIGMIAIYIIVAFSTTCAQSGGNSNLGRYYKDISFFGLYEFTNMDLGVIAYFPTQEHWNQISKNVKLLPVDSLRYIDSLDVRRVADTLFVKMYTQNYAYQSQNVYKISKNTNSETDTLMVFNIQIDLEMKNFIDDAETFRRKDYTVDYIVKQISDKFDKRIVINKNYL